MHLNALPLSFSEASRDDIVHYASRDDARLALLKGCEKGEVRWYSHQQRIYFWRANATVVLPSNLLAGSVDLLASALPAEVLAYVARTEIVRHLADDGWEVIADRIGSAARVFRRSRNLAGTKGSAFPTEAGAFPYLAVQHVVLDLPTGPNPALVVDAGVVNRLDVPLPGIAKAGVSLVQLPVVWDHSGQCGCPDADTQVGHAGVLVGGDPETVVRVAADHHEFDAPSRCLRARPSRAVVASYLEATLNAKNIESRLDQATKRFHAIDEQWKLLGHARELLDGIVIFSSMKLQVGEPLALADAQGIGMGLLPAATPAVLSFSHGAPEVNRSSAIGLNKYGPYDKDAAHRRNRVRFVILSPDSFAAQARRLRDVLRDGLGQFPGFAERYKLESVEVEVKTFTGILASDYRSAANGLLQESGVDRLPDLVFVVSQQADKLSAPGQNAYLTAKAIFVNAGVATQGITVETLRQVDSSFTWTIQSLAVQSYAKLGNIPFVLRDAEAGVREMLLGVGRSDPRDITTGSRSQLFGAAAVFRQNGDFLFAGSTAPVIPHETYERDVAQMLREFIDRFEREEAAPPERLIIHLFKKTGRRELSAIEQAIAGREIAFALVHVNRDTPYWLVDAAHAGVTAAMPGTVVQLGEGDRLVMTGEKNRSMHPLRLTLDRNSTYRDMDRLTEQLLGLTQVSLRSFRTTHEPNTVLYGRLLAEKVGQLLPYGFSADRAAAIGGRPWFL